MSSCAKLTHSLRPLSTALKMRRVLAGRGDLGGFPDHVEEMPWRMRRGACGLWCWPSTELLERVLEPELAPLLLLRLPSAAAAGGGGGAWADEAVRRCPPCRRPANDRLRASTEPESAGGRGFSRSLSDMSAPSIIRTDCQRRPKGCCSSAVKTSCDAMGAFRRSDKRLFRRERSPRVYPTSDSQARTRKSSHTTHTIQLL